jgi:TM2 domain-containing membrane protein YozV
MSETTSVPSETEAKSFLVTWLLSLLLGLLGVDRFYLGKVGTGLAKLFTLGGLGVWYLIDLILILANAAKDKNGLALEGYEKSKVAAWVVSGVVLVAAAAVGSAGDDETVSSGSESSSSSSSSSDATDSERDAESSADEAEESSSDNGSPTVGDTARTEDGVDVTLISVTGPVATPNGWIIDNPKGELVAVEMEMFNDSDEPMNLSTSSVTAYIGNAEYEASALFGPSGDWFVYEDVNPKLGTKFTAYFDMPVGSRPTQIEFASSIFFGEAVVFQLD